LETDATQKLVLCATTTTVSAIAFGCAKAAADNVCSTVTATDVNPSGGSGYIAAGQTGLKTDTTTADVMVSGSCCDGLTHDCNDRINCWKGMVGAGTVTATGKFMDTLTGTGATAASVECPAPDNYCVAIVVDCSLEADATQKLVICAAAATTRAE